MKTYVSFPIRTRSLKITAYAALILAALLFLFHVCDRLEVPRVFIAYGLLLLGEMGILCSVLFSLKRRESLRTASKDNEDDTTRAYPLARSRVW